MANQFNEKLESIQRRLNKSASVSNIREYLNVGCAVARRAEASKSVTGFFGGGILDTINQIIQVATPLVSMSGDYELSALLSSLKVWLDKKKAQEAADKAQRNQMMNQGYDSLNFTYSF